MKYHVSIFLLFVTFLCFSQNRHQGILVDSETKEPLEFVSVFNSKDQTVSNSDGQFNFTSTQDTIVFYQVGYDKLTTNFKQLKDTTFLKKSVFELNEVVVTNAKTIYQRIKDSVASNYFLKPHSEIFFLRVLLKKNDTIIRLQDFQGLLKRKTSIYAGGLELDKKDYQVAIRNMRKIGVSKDENKVYYSFPSFYDIFSEFVRLNAMGVDFDVTEQPSEDEKHLKVDFKSNVSEKKGKALGHYIINSNDNAILSFKATVFPFYGVNNNPDKLASKVLENKVSIFFKEDESAKLYFMNSAKRETKIQVVGPNKSFTDVYDMSIVLITSKSFENEDVKSNTNEHKDIFKLKHQYDPDYWNSQNQLLLTEEMQEFINTMGQENNEFKVRSNMN